jgi:valyl-tRNA synthetase
MSKSLGNVIDPKEVIASHGSDALRMGIIAGRSPGYSAAYAPSKIDAGRNYANKLWNIARFINDKLGDAPLSPTPIPKSAADHYILHKLQQSTEEISVHLDNYRFSEAYDTLYHTVWDDVADWYIEASKGQQNNSVLQYVLRTALVLSHPFAPFVTETIWQTLAFTGDSILATHTWPAKVEYNEKTARTFEEIKTIVTEARTIISNLGLQKSTLYFTDVPFLKDNAELLTRLAGLAGVHEVASGHGLHLTNTKYRCWLDVDEETAARYIGKLRTQKEQFERVISNLSTRLENKNYVKNAPKQLVDETRDQLKNNKALLAGIENEIKRFSR